MKFILGKKIEMTQVWDGDKVVGVTKIQAGPCVAVQIKNEEKDGYKAIQVGFGVKKEKNIKKPQRGHTKGLGSFRYLREFRIIDEKIEKGNQIDIATFEKGDIVRVTGVSKGKGFQGVVKRWGFAGQIKTHGNKDQLRMPGSIGATGPAHVFKGTRMGGRMGGKQITTTNLEIIEVDVENGIILVKGSVPGARNSMVMLKGPGELRVIKKAEVKVEDTSTSSAQGKKVKEVKEDIKKESPKVEEKKEVKETKKEDKVVNSAKDLEDKK